MMDAQSKCSCMTFMVALTGSFKLTEIKWNIIADDNYWFHIALLGSLSLPPTINDHYIESREMNTYSVIVFLFSTTDLLIYFYLIFTRTNHFQNRTLEKTCLWNTIDTLTRHWSNRDRNTIRMHTRNGSHYVKLVIKIPQSRNHKKGTLYT